MSLDGPAFLGNQPGAGTPGPEASVRVSFVYNREERILPAGLGAVTLRRILEFEGVSLDGLIQRSMGVTLDGELRVLQQRNYSLRLNGTEAPLDSALAASDCVDFEPGSGFRDRIRDLWNSDVGRMPTSGAGDGAVRLLLNGAWAPLDRIERVWMNGREVDMDESLVEGADIRVQRMGPCKTVAQGVERLGFSPWLKGGRLKIALNGRGVSLSEPLADGDALDLSLDEGAAPR